MQTTPKPQLPIITVLEYSLSGLWKSDRSLTVKIKPINNSALALMCSQHLQIMYAMHIEGIMHA